MVQRPPWVQSDFHSFPRCTFISSVLELKGNDVKLRGKKGVRNVVLLVIMLWYYVITSSMTCN